MEFPTTLKGFGYEFKDGKLRQIENGEPFNFQVKEDDHQFNQKHYEALGEVITEEIYKLLQERCGLHSHSVPVDAGKNDPTTQIFSSNNYSSNENLLILIHGSGVVRAGQWARRLIINECLDSGTQIPFIERGVKEGYGVLVFNTNDNTRFIGDKKERIKGSENAVSHSIHVWRHFVQPCKAKRIFIVAHSFGGIVVTELFKEYKSDFKKRVAAVAMTDSVHSLNNASNYKRLINISQNWVTSSKDLDTPITRNNDIPCVSAGCLQHEMTSWSSFDSIFNFFNKKLGISKPKASSSSSEGCGDAEETPSKKGKFESIIPKEGQEEQTSCTDSQMSVEECNPAES